MRIWLRDFVLVDNNVDDDDFRTYLYTDFGLIIRFKLFFLVLSTLKRLIRVPLDDILGLL